jgi:hypothetical protein
MLGIVIPFNIPLPSLLPLPHRYNLSKLDKSKWTRYFCGHMVNISAVTWLIFNVDEKTVILFHGVNVRY